MLYQNYKLVLCFSISVLLQLNGIWADTSKIGFNKDPKIKNGTDATAGATGHQVSIRSRFADSRSFGDGHRCGGSLISENVVLSAAHCFVKPHDGVGDSSFLPDSDFIVVMGNLNRLERNNNNLIVDAIKIVKPTEKFSSTFEDDIAIIILNGKVPAKHPTVRPIMLNQDTIPNNTMCQVTGWGVTEENKLSDKLKSLDVSYIDYGDCREKSAYGSLIREGMICAADPKGERSACSADSGGPLVCRGTQAGIVSFGGGCVNPSSPTVYADVAFYKDWILKQVAHYNATLPVFAHVDNGVTTLSCSIFLLSLMLIFNYFYSEII